MNIDWNKFKTMFPSYKKHKTMMWSEVLKTDELFRLRIVIPGYNKEDFELYEDNGTIRLLLNKDRGVGKNPSTYILFDENYSDKYDLNNISARYKNGVLEVEIKAKGS